MGFLRHNKRIARAPPTRPPPRLGEIEKIPADGLFLSPRLPAFPREKSRPREKDTKREILPRWRDPESQIEIIAERPAEFEILIDEEPEGFEQCGEDPCQKRK